MDVRKEIRETNKDFQARLLKHPAAVLLQPACRTSSTGHVQILYGHSLLPPVAAALK